MGFGLGGILGSIGGALNPVGLIANVGAGLIGGVSDYFSAREAADAQRDVNSENVSFGREGMAFSAAQAQRQMDFQREMSNTAFQRARKDLEAAGINPMLAAGSPESSPSGAMGSSMSVTQQAVPPTIGAALSGAKDTLRLLQDVSESNSRIKLNKDLGSKAKADAGLSNVSAEEKSAGAYIEAMKKRLLLWIENSAKGWDGKLEKSGKSGSGLSLDSYDREGYKY